MTDAWHSLLGRQLQRCLGLSGETPEAWRPLLQAVNEAYRAFDTDRVMLERSLELMSQELTDRNQQLQRELEERRRTEAILHEKVHDLERLNRIMMGREERIIELKDEVKHLQAKVDQTQPSTHADGTT